jgi:predicted secreted acid phosphatase
MLPNPTYGTWESLPAETPQARRQAKRDALDVGE